MDGKVEQFISVTGASADEARRLLEACGGNLELAVSMHLEAASSVGGTTSSASGASEKSYEEIHGVRAPIPQTRGVLIEEEAPPRRVFRSRRLPQTVFDPFQDYSKGVVAGPGSSSKKKSLAELFRPPFDIMFQGTFDEARLAGQQRRKWLLVNVQDSKEFASQVLNRDIWNNAAIKDVIKRGFIFWQIHRITDDGVKFKQLYHVNSYPYVAVIDPRTGENMANWNQLTISKFLTEVQEFLASNPFEEDVDEPGGSGSMLDQSEESQLEAAIRASLEEMQGSRPGRSGDDFVTLTDSEEEFHSLSDGESENERETVDGMDRNPGLWPGQQEMDTDSVERITTNSRKSTGVGGTISPGVKLKSCTVDIHPISPIVQSRKRPSSGETDGRLPAKLPRSDRYEAKEHDITQTDKSQTASSGSKQNTDRNGTQLPCTKKKGNRVSKKGKNKAVLASVEEQLAAGTVSKEEVSHILIRLPDGSRVQKAFICHHPIEELFQFLQTQGTDLSEHEVVTQFPRRSISSLQWSTSFRDIGLYPRETVIVHPVD